MGSPLIDAIDVRPYRLPMRTPFRVHGADIIDREGWLVRVVAEGVCGVGESAPLPWFGTESLDAAGESLHRASVLVGSSVDDAQAWLSASQTPPTARCALSTALADLDARRRHCSLSSRLGASEPSTLGVHLAVGRDQDARTAIRAAFAAGVSHVKLKLGRTMISEAIERISAAVRVNPGVRIRLDANGAWTRDEARRWLDALAGLPIDFVEQPVASTDIEGLVELAATSVVPVAIDEGLLFADGVAAARAGRFPVVVIKPMALGGPCAAVGLASACGAAGSICVVTTFLDAAVGRAMATHVAAAVAPTGVHGLATGGLLAADVAPGPRVTGGAVEVPIGPGLGDAVEGAW